MNRKSTKEHLLDNAEKLFARNGYHSTSMRMLTRKAGVNLSAVNYHFGSKKDLIRSVIERRLTVLNKKREELLDQVLARANQSNTRPCPRDVLKSFIAPTLEFRDRFPQAAEFPKLISRALTEPDDMVRNMFIEIMTPLFQKLFESLCLALPGLSRTQVYWRLHFCLGSMFHVMNVAERIRIIPDGVEMPASQSQLVEPLLDFIAAGMERNP
jgi:AcrR family transcriptional regulator